MLNLRRVGVAFRFILQTPWQISGKSQVGFTEIPKTKVGMRVRQGTHKPLVAGSIPASGTNPFAVQFCRPLRRTIPSSPVRQRQLPDKPVFNLLACPWCLAQKGQAGFHCGIEEETANGNPAAHLHPAVPGHELVDDVLERDAVQRVARVMRGGWHTTNRSNQHLLPGHLPRLSTATSARMHCGPHQPATRSCGKTSHRAAWAQTRCSWAA